MSHPTASLKTSRLLTGLIAAPFTPLRADASLNLAAVPAYAAHLARDGVKAAFVCGTTGEGPSLTTAERMRVTEAWCEAKPGIPVIVHVGHNAIAECCDLARHAQETGAVAIATLAPGFFRPPATSGLVDWCAPIAAAAPDLPFYFYHMPSMVGSEFPMAEFLPKAAQAIPTFAGIKYTHNDLMDFGDALGAAAGRYSVLCGRDEILLPCLALGAEGGVGSTYNYAAPLFQRLIAAFARGDLAEARKWQALARAFIGVITRFGGLGANKMAMNLATGIDCGPTRPPLGNLPPAQVALLRAQLEAVGFFAGIAAAKNGAAPGP
ncbi:MAG: dihydrodipicolinate synthetase [Verrucomicrobia bacterium]|nr:dihydrodipicolinate synthetase [Verrucomicrobiota bacterium]